MKKILLIMGLVAVAMTAAPAQELNRTIMDPRLNREVLFGYCDRDGLKTGEMGETFQSYYDTYQPDPAVVERLAPHLKKTRILVILGSWCSDSQEQVPGFFRVLVDCGYRSSKVKMICVNRDKLAGEIDLVKYNIERVPTFIFYRKGKEMGRIVETPVKTLEEDMLEIVVGSW